MKICLICTSKIKHSLWTESSEKFEIECPKCGTYQLTRSAAHSKLNLSNENKLLFSGYIKNNSTKRNPILISSDILNKIDQIIFPYKNMSVLDKKNKIIFYLAETSPHIGYRFEFKLNEIFSAFYCKTKEELVTLLLFLKSKNFIDCFSGLEMNPFNISSSHISELTFGEMLTEEIIGVSLLIPGWERYEELKETNIESNQVFVAMNFDAKLDSLFNNAILPACTNCDLKSFRIDQEEHNEKICDKIITEIRRSRFLIADFTGQKHGVYFEAGYAYGLGIPVIWCCKKEDIDNLHFDTRQYNHIIWETEEELKEKLINRIKATIT